MWCKGGFQRHGVPCFCFRSNKDRPILTPTPNLAAKFQNVERLQENIKLRGMNMNAAELKELWEFYCSLNETRGDLEKRRVQIAGEIKDLKKVWPLAVLFGFLIERTSFITARASFGIIKQHFVRGLIYLLFLRKKKFLVSSVDKLI